MNKQQSADDKQTSAQAFVERHFSVTHDGQFDPGTFTLSEMLIANREDTEFVSWLIQAKVGDEYKNGGGAAPIFRTRRVI